MKFLVQLVLCMHLIAPLTSWAQTMAAKDPMNYPLKTYGFMLFVAVMGGFVSFYAKVRRNEIAGASLMHLIGEIATSAFAGLLVFWLCEWLDVPQILTAPLVGVAGHMGAKVITLLEEAAKRKFNQKVSSDPI